MAQYLDIESMIDVFEDDDFLAKSPISDTFDTDGKHVLKKDPDTIIETQDESDIENKYVEELMKEMTRM